MNKKRLVQDFLLTFTGDSFTVESACSRLYERWRIEVSLVDMFEYIYSLERDGYFEREKGVPLTWKRE